MQKRRLLGTLAVISLVGLAACPPRDRTDVRATDTIVPPPATTAPPVTAPGVTPMPVDTPMRVDTPMVRDTPQVGAPRVP